MANLDSIGAAMEELTRKYAGIVSDETVNSIEEVPEMTSEATATSDTSTSTSAKTSPTMITLNVGGYKFQTTVDTLRDQSGYLRSLLSDKDSWQPEDDGSYFLDADPDLFEHLLRFMRRPNVFPVLYTANDGFNYDMYIRLQNEAEYFEINTLRDWIKNKRYLDAVKVIVDPPIIKDASTITGEVMPSNRSVDYRVVPRTKKIPMCPRQIAEHRGRPDRCGTACKKRQKEIPVMYEDEVIMEVMVVNKAVEFVGSVCGVEGAWS